MDKELFEILTPEGEVFEIPLWTLKKLSAAKFLYRDHASGLQKLKSSIYGFLELFDGIDATRPRQVHAYNYERPQAAIEANPLAGLRRGRR
jgi:hypothetical protein